MNFDVQLRKRTNMKLMLLLTACFATSLIAIPINTDDDISSLTDGATDLSQPLTIDQSDIADQGTNQKLWFSLSIHKIYYESHRKLILTPLKSAENSVRDRSMGPRFTNNLDLNWKFQSATDPYWEIVHTWPWIIRN